MVVIINDVFELVDTLRKYAIYSEDSYVLDSLYQENKNLLDSIVESSLVFVEQPPQILMAEARAER